MLNMLFVDSSDIQLRHPYWAFPRSTHLNGLIVLHKPAISLSLSGAELFATDSQLTCQEIASRSKPISSQAPTTQLPRYFSSQLDYFQTCLWERACKSCNVNVQFLFLARIVAVTASNHFCLIPAYPREHCTFQMPKNELTLPKGGCSPPLIISPRTALITVAPILDRSLPTVYQLIAEHSLLRS